MINYIFYDVKSIITLQIDISPIKGLIWNLNLGLISEIS